MADHEIDEEELLRKEIAFNELIVDFKRLKLKAQKRAIEDKLSQYYKKLIDEKMYDEFEPAAQPILKTVDRLKDITDNIIDSKNGSNTHCFFTINVKPERATENHLGEFHVELKKFFDSCVYTKTAYVYSIEQRSEGAEDMHGMHCHILFEKLQHSPSKIQRAFQNKFFDKWVGTPASLDYRYGSGDFVCRKAEYILGFKENSKMAKVDKDRKIKDAHRIDWWYSKGKDIRQILEDIASKHDDKQLNIHMFPLEN